MIQQQHGMEGAVVGANAGGELMIEYTTHVMPDGTTFTAQVPPMPADIPVEAKYNNGPYEHINKNIAPPQLPWNETYRGVPVRKVPGLSNSAADVMSHAILPHCYLCNDDKDYIIEKRLLAHVSRCHLKPAIEIGSVMVLLCKRYCSDKHKDAGHYHCLFCEFCCRQKQRLKVHVEKHLRMMHKRTDTAECHLPTDTMDHSLPDDEVEPANLELVREWEAKFNHFITENYDKKAKTNNNIMTERKKWLIYNHTRHGMDLEDKSLKYWTRFRGVKVINCPALNYIDVLVMPLTKYNNDADNNVVDVQPDPLPEGCYDLLLDPRTALDEFRKSYRIIPTQEQLFKILYRIHIDNHLPPKNMFGRIRQDYLYLPRAVVDTFVAMCPDCCNHYNKSTNYIRPKITHHNANTVTFGSLKITVINMKSEHNRVYHYAVEVMDRHSHLTWVFPVKELNATEVGNILVTRVFGITGLPRVVTTNVNVAFTEKLVYDIQRRWHAPCNELIANSVALLHRAEDGEARVIPYLNDLMTDMPPGEDWALSLPYIQSQLNVARGEGEATPHDRVLGRGRGRGA